MPVGRWSSGHGETTVHPEAYGKTVCRVAETLCNVKFQRREGIPPPKDRKKEALAITEKGVAFPRDGGEADSGGRRSGCGASLQGVSSLTDPPDTEAVRVPRAKLPPWRKGWERPNTNITSIIHQIGPSVNRILRN